MGSQNQHRNDDDLDLNRLPYEITRALDKECVMVEQLEPGLAMRPEAEELVVLKDGVELCRVPRYRLRASDPELLRKTAAATLSTLPVGMADQCVAAINEGRFEVIEPPDDDYVYCHIFLGEEPFKFFAAHRRCVIVGWPEEDV